jgi:phage terminase large subunit-like protein
LNEEAELLALLAMADRERATHRLQYYVPYPKQAAFHNAIGKNTGKPASQKLLLGGNQIGKTWCAAMETAYHLTGQYPDWWEGARYTMPVTAMIGSNTNETCRDIVQKELFGEPLDDEKIGTGTIPIECIGNITRKAGVVNAYDSVSIKHVSGKNSTVYLRAYEQGFKKFMGIRFQVGWLDEEPPSDVWSQFLRAGLAQKNAILYITMTPEEGMTKVVTQFMNDLQDGQAVVTAGWEDAAHFTPEIIKAKLAAFSPHEREMRSKGVPLMGAGLIFSHSDDDIKIEPFEIPRHWPQIIGIDFGWDHPFAAAKIAWDRDNDCIYVTNEYRESKCVPAVHALAIKSWGEWVPVAWPHDGLNTEKGTGEQLREKYVEAGVNMLPWKATNPPQAGQTEGEGGNSVEASILEMNQRMASGRFKIFSTCQHFFDEKRMYHRDLKGKIVKQNDDLLSACRYSTMMVRHARVISVKPRKSASTSRGASNWA